MKKEYRILVLFIIILLLFTSIFVYKFFNTDNPSFLTSKSVSIDKGDNSKKITLVFSYGGSDHKEIFKRNAELFHEANPNIEVKLQQLSTTTDYQRSTYKSALPLEGNNIDVFYSDTIWTSEFASLGLTLPLDKYFTKNIQKDFTLNSIAACVYKDSIYAVPGHIDAPFLYYRKDIIPTPPKTYEELIADITTYKNSPRIKYGYIYQGYSYEGLVCNALEFIWSNGAGFGDKNTPIINMPAAVKGIEKFIALARPELNSPDMLTFQEDDSLLAFQDGTALFMRNWPYAYTQLNSDNSKVKGIFDIAPLPLTSDGSQSLVTLGGWNFSISKNSKNPDIAWKFIQWMTSLDSQLKACLAGSVPTRKALYDNPEFLKQVPWISNYKSVFETAKLRPVTPYYSLISEDMQINFKNAITNKITATKALENIAQNLKYISEIPEP
ncbi:MAG: ABC transporter substrate-binding protein [Clostridiaceae bacterium]|nr:ABC transporter substrate-binding protein [Clostridiaceae bacterium]